VPSRRFSVGRQIHAPRFGTVAQEVTLGKASLMLMMSKEKHTDSNDKVHIAGSDIVCLSIMVRDLDATRAVIKGRSGRTLEVYKGIYGNSVSIPANLTMVSKLNSYRMPVNRRLRSRKWVFSATPSERLAWL
jgi:hypothetical protein